MVLCALVENTPCRHGNPERASAVAFNPLGGFHHAMPANAEGFCYLNDIVIAILMRYAFHPGIKIAYVDFDAHHRERRPGGFLRRSRGAFHFAHETGRTLYPWSEARRKSEKDPASGTPSTFPGNRARIDEVYSYILDAAVFPILKALLRTSSLPRSERTP